MSTDSKQNVDRLVKLAAKNITKGVIEEPRVYYDVITLAAPQGGGPTLPGPTSLGDPDVFINREKFPVRITRMSAQLLWKQVEGGVVGLNESMIQGAGLRVRHHDDYYMSNRFLPIPQWANQYVALSPSVTLSTSTWTFDCPVILSARDSLRVEAGVVLDLNNYFDPATVEDVMVSVSFTGTGLLSGRPYFYGAEQVLPTTPGSKVTLQPTNLRNTGAEPVALTSMTVSQPGFTLDDGDSQLFQGGNIRLVDIQIRQQGNGTNADWFRGPSQPTLRPRCPAGLLGYNGGRAVVHALPGDGLIWEPGDGITPELVALVANLQEGLGEVMPDIAISFSGYVSIV